MLNKLKKITVGEFLMFMFATGVILEDSKSFTFNSTIGVVGVIVLLIILMKIEQWTARMDHGE